MSIQLLSHTMSLSSRRAFVFATTSCYRFSLSRALQLCDANVGTTRFLSSNSDPFRFQKIGIELEPLKYPLYSENPPQLRNAVRERSLADSPIDIQNDFETNKNETEREISFLIEELARDRNEWRRVFPENKPFWKGQFKKVVDLQLLRRDERLNRKKVRRIKAMMPDIWKRWKKFNLTTIAEAVNSEYPALHQGNLLDEFFASGSLRPYPNEPNFRSLNDFVGLQARLACINTWAFHAVAPVNFGLKWIYGMPRPEEVAFAITEDKLTTDDGIPRDVVEMVKEMNLGSAPEFTAYEKGCPFHPSWPAMHSAGSTLSTWLPAVVDLKPEQYEQALRTDYAVSYGRSVAGVHYNQDNLAGLNIGMKIMQLKLPQYLAKEFGYNENTIRERLDALAFDWNDYNPRQCKIGDLTAGEHLAKIARTGELSFDPEVRAGRASW